MILISLSQSLTQSHPTQPHHHPHPPHPPQAAVHEGRPFYGTAFGEPSGLADDVETIGRCLTAHGFSYHGKDMLTSGEGYW